MYLLAGKYKVNTHIHLREARDSAAVQHLTWFIPIETERLHIDIKGGGYICYSESADPDIPRNPYPA